MIMLILLRHERRSPLCKQSNMQIRLCGTPRFVPRSLNLKEQLNLEDWKINASALAVCSLHYDDNAIRCKCYQIQKTEALYPGSLWLVRAFPLLSSLQPPMVQHSTALSPLGTGSIWIASSVSS